MCYFRIKTWMFLFTEIVSLGVIYFKVLLARWRRKVAEICLLALLYPFFAHKISRTTEQLCMKFCQGVLLKCIDTCQFWI